MKSKNCSKCGLLKEVNIDNFKSEKSCSDGFRNVCRECSRKLDAIFRERNREKIREQARKFRESHIDIVRQRARLWAKQNRPSAVEAHRKRKSENWFYYFCMTKKTKANKYARKYNRDGILTTQNIMDILNESKMVCYYCKEKIPEKLMTIDHKIAMRVGGSNHMDNIVACCYSCNSKKHSKTPEQFKAYMGFP